MQLTYTLDKFYLCVCMLDFIITNLYKYKTKQEQKKIMTKLANNVDIILVFFRTNICTNMMAYYGI